MWLYTALRILAWIFVICLIMIGGAFIGKTSITSTGIHIERPVTVILYLLACIAAAIGI